MTASTSTIETAVAERSQIEGLLSRVIPLATTADALARRTVGRIRTVALLGLLSAAWLTYACATRFDWGLASAFVMFTLLAIPTAVLWKMYGMLNAVVGLPQRITDTTTRLYGKTIEYRELYESRGRPGATEGKPKFKQLWQTAKSFLEARALTNEAQEIVTLAGGALVLANPLFGIVLGCTTAVTLLLSAIAGLVGLAYVF